MGEHEIRVIENEIERIVGGIRELVTIKEEIDNKQIGLRKQLQEQYALRRKAYGVDEEVV